LGAGERQAILLAQAIGADILLIDERYGRRAARLRALRVLGTMGILDEAATRGLLDLPTALTRLQATNFRVTHEMVQALLARDAARRG
jgi:predicted nucleic acid-binding protein